MPSPDLFRFRIRFAKTEAMRYTGHLDVYRTWERTFRRAGLPLAYSRGFSPRPRLQIGAALPLGCISEGDLLDAWLERDLEPEVVRAQLASASPPGLRIQDVHRIEAAGPALPGQVVAAHYEVVSEVFPEAVEMERRVSELQAAAALPRTRRGKVYDLRPLIERLRFDPVSSALHMDLAAREGAAGRADEVLMALGVDPADATACRTRLVLESSPAGQTTSG